MEVYLNREEIRRRLQARMGFVTDNAQAPLLMVQVNEFIRAACHEVFTRCQWSKLQRETRVTVGIDQRFVNYPANSSAGNIIQIGAWDPVALRYVGLRRAVIRVHRDTEPKQEEGGDTAEEDRGFPSLYQPKAQIEIWPRPDQSYELKIDHTTSPELGDDTTPSIVDAEAIILWAMADTYDFQGDTELAKVQRGKFESRIAQLRAWQHTGESFRRGAADTLLLSRQSTDPVPNYDTRPSVAE